MNSMDNLKPKFIFYSFESKFYIIFMILNSNCEYMIKKIFEAY